MMLLQITEYLVTLIEVLLGLSVNSKVFDTKTCKMKETVMVSVLIAFVAWILNQFWFFSIIVTIFGLVGIALSSHLIYKIKIVDSIALTVVYLLLVYIIDFLSISLFGVVVKDTQFANVVTSRLSYMRLCYLIFDKTLLCIIYVVLERKYLAKIEIPMRKLGVGIILTGTLVYILVKRTLAHIDSDIFLVWLLFLLLVMAVLYLAIQVISYIQSHDRMAMAMERNALLADSYKKAIRQYQSEQIFYHDLKNQFLIIENYMKNRNFDKAEAYIERLSSTKVQLPRQRTGIEVLDILMEYKKREAEEQGIQIEISAEIVGLRLTEGEIVALFGNLFDNAIEACSKVEGDGKWIRVIIRRMQEMTFVKISNAYKGQPVFEAEHFRSSKNDKRMHGLGMTSMRMIVDQYEGHMDVWVDCDAFTVVISFFH